MMKEPSQLRRRAYRLGLSGEAKAALWLRLKGYRILARRHSRGPAEIDIIAKRGRTIAFVEVKARATFEAGLEAVSAVQRRRIVRAAEGFLANNPRHAGCAVRFDVLIVPSSGRPRHLSDAFDAGR